MDLILLMIAAYVVVQLGIGILVSRGINTEQDYLIAGRKLGYGLTTFTIFATWFGAETCIGAAGAIYTHGLSGGTADPLGYSLCIIFMGVFFAIPLWKLRLTTIGDFFRLRFGDRVERLAVILLIPASLLWAAAQVRGFGQILAVSSGLDVDWMIAAAAGIVIAYTVYGGLIAAVWTDLIQGGVLIGGLVALFVLVFADHGWYLVSSIDADRLDLFPYQVTGWLSIIEAWAIPIIGSVTSAELLTRAIAARSSSVAQRSALMAGGLYLLIGLIPVILGLVGVLLLPELADPEELLPQLARQYFPGIFYAIFVGALVSAILSTVDSTLLVAASLLSHNVIVPLFNSRLDESARISIARANVLLFGCLAYVLAMHADGVYALVIEASAFGSAGTVVVITMGLFTQYGAVRAATGALLGGVVSWVIGAYMLNLEIPYLTSLVVALLCYFLGAIADKAKGQALHSQVKGYGA
jgi:Na+/proline symporter